MAHVTRVPRSGILVQQLAFHTISHKNTDSGLTDSGTAFRAFGAGANICPGRFLALGGIERVIEVLVRDWEIKPVSERWTVGRGLADDVSDTVIPPDGDIEVWITSRH